MPSKAAGLIGRGGGKPSRKGTGFVQPLADRDKKLEEARRRRKPARQTHPQSKPDYENLISPALA